MSFASEVKKEMCEIPASECCRKAECYGLFLFGRNFTPACVSLTTESQAAARRAAEYAAQTAGTVMDVSSSILRTARSPRVFTVSAADSGEAEKIRGAFGHAEREISLHINLANVENDCCRAAFLRGAFLSCGTASSPQKEYHLEFAVPYRNLARDLSAFLRGTLELDLKPGLSTRKGAYVVYIKGAEPVSDLLTYMGAPRAAMDLMQARMFKELRNNVNRQTNCETANLGKTASAAAGQVLIIENILNSPAGLSALPEDLRELASLRRENPEMSLRELGQNLSKPLSRSGVYHRLQRIEQIAEKLP